MDIIRFTFNAENFLSFIPSLDLTLSVNNCFKGLLPWPGGSIPNIYESVKRLGKEINACKSSLTERNDSLCNRLFRKGVIPAFNHNIDFLIENCSIYLATSEDIGNTWIKVKNIFNQKEEDLLITEKVYAVDLKNDLKEIEIDKRDYLGLYYPETGSIVLFIDRIFNYVEANLIFQEVLLHELIHALLDITPRLLKPDGTTITLINNCSEIEEKYDNTLVLYVYLDWSKCDKEVQANIKGFTESQKPPYSDAIKCHEENKYEDFKEVLIEKLLSLKMRAAEERLPHILPATIKCNTVYDAIKYSVLNQDEPDENSRMEIVNENKDFFNQLSVSLIHKVNADLQPEYYNPRTPEFICLYRIKLKDPHYKISITRISQDFGNKKGKSNGELPIFCTIFIKIESEDNKIILTHTSASSPITSVYIQSTRDEVSIKDMYEKFIKIIESINNLDGEYTIEIPPAFEELKNKEMTSSKFIMINKII